VAEKKMTKRQAQAIETRTKIYNVAIDLMVKKGYDNITVEEISAKAGVSIGAFYHYFKAKYDIFIEIYKRGDDYFKDTVVPNLKGSTAIDKILEFFDHYVTFNETTGMDIISQLYNVKNKSFIRKNRPMFLLLKGIVAEGQAKGEIEDDLSAEDIAEYLYVGARGIIFHWCLYNKKWDLRERLTLFMRRLVPTFKKQA
jgi:AcrR family transcriptional regulator